MGNHIAFREMQLFGTPENEHQAVFCKKALFFTGFGRLPEPGYHRLSGMLQLNGGDIFKSFRVSW
jgi:hypothetical protein